VLSGTLAGASGVPPYGSTVGNAWHFTNMDQMRHCGQIPPHINIGYMSGAPGPKNVVLVVDDEPEVRRMATAVLSMAGFSAQVAANGLEGLRCFMRHEHEICLVLSDVVMPVMSGVQMVAGILEIEPDTPILMMSAYSDEVLEIKARERYAFIRKPFLAQDLVAKIPAVIGEPAAGASA
jgi:DNA-binding NtrC family response regulator